MDHSNSNKLPLIPIIIVGGLLLRFIALTETTLFLDEGYTILFSEISVDTLLKNISKDANPPLGYLFYKTWIAIFGSSTFAIESASVILGCFSIYLFYHLALLIFNRETANITSLMFCLSAFHVHFSQQIRAYSLAICIELICVIFLFKAIRTGLYRYFTAFVIFSTLAFATHYYLLFSIIAWFIWVATQRKEIKSSSMLSNLSLSSKVSLALITCIALFFVWTLFRQAFFYRSFLWIKAPSWKSFSDILLALSNDSRLLLVIFVTLFVVQIYQLIKDSKLPSNILLCLIWLIVPFILSLLASLLNVPVFHNRYFIFVLPPLYLLIANQIVKQEKYSVLLLLAICIGSAISLVDYFDKQRSFKYRSDFYNSINNNYSSDNQILHLHKRTFIEAWHYNSEFPNKYLLKGETVSNVFLFLPSTIQKDWNYFYQTRKPVICIESFDTDKTCEVLGANFEKVRETEERDLKVSYWIHSKTL